MTAACWICEGEDLRRIEAANLPSAVDATAFRVTDAHYGQRAAIYQCQACQFRQCSELPDVLAFYEAMDDPGYESSRGPRILQADRLIRVLRPFRPRGRLLDVGAGSGILVEAASLAGYQAEGVEPSAWMARQAAEHGQKVHNGVLPMEGVTGPFDLVTLVDVLEHVSDPVDLLAQARAVMADDGYGLVITPDVASIAARAMGRKWWHYRLAHICYFDERTLMKALAKAGLEPVRVFRPAWFFTADYLVQRLGSYIPPLRKVKVKALERITVPLNLFDSLAVVFRRAGAPAP